MIYLFVTLFSPGSDIEGTPVDFVGVDGVDGVDDDGGLRNAASASWKLVLADDDEGLGCSFSRRNCWERNSYTKRTRKKERALAGKRHSVVQRK
jgi:hypothetical protein